MYVVVVAGVMNKTAGIRVLRGDQARPLKGRPMVWVEKLSKSAFFVWLKPFGKRIVLIGRHVQESS